MNYNKGYLFDFLILFAYLSWIVLVIMTHIFQNVLFLFSRHSRQRTLSRYYIQSGEKNMNYAKKLLFLLPC